MCLMGRQTLLNGDRTRYPGSPTAVRPAVSVEITAPLYPRGVTDGAHLWKMADGGLLGTQTGRSFVRPRKLGGSSGPGGVYDSRRISTAVMSV